MLEFEPKTKNCPACGHLIDALSSALDNDKGPKEKDISICIYCGVFLMFQKDLTFKIMDAEDFKDLPHKIYEGIIEIRDKIAELNYKEYGKPWPSIGKKGD